MSYVFEHGETVEQGLRRIATTQLDSILAETDDHALSMHERVHSARKRCKKVRALLRLVAPGLGRTFKRENQAVRDAARLLSELRDSQTMLATFDGLVQRYEVQFAPDAFEEVRRLLAHHRDELTNETPHSPQLRVFRDAVAEIRQRAKQWKLEAEGVDSLVDGLQNIYARGQREMKNAYGTGTGEHFHEWRKRVKDHWSHQLLLENVWPSVMTAYSRETKQLADFLGDDHDLTVLSHRLQRSPSAFGSDRNVQALTALAKSRCDELRQEARPIAQRLFARRPKDVGREARRLWRAWQQFG